MKLVVLALAVSFAATTALPVLAADRAATSVPVQLAQKTDKDKDKDKGAAKAKGASKKKDNDRSNKGGATRGDARSDQVQGMKKGGNQ
jgi:Ni/Co efflux regulator RcnB